MGGRRTETGRMSEAWIISDRGQGCEDGKAWNGIGGVSSESGWAVLAGAAREGLARKWHCHRAMGSRVLGEIYLGKRNSKCKGPEV